MKKPPITLNPTEETNRRAAIIRGAGRLFRDKGYAATTIRDIAGAVGMRSGSPFYHFKTKHDMLQAVVQEGMEAMHLAVENAANAGLPLRAKFEAMVGAHLQALLDEEGRDVAATLLHESRHLDPTALREVVARRDRYESMWRQVLVELKQAGLIHDDSPAIRLFLLGAMNWTTQWYKNDRELSPQQLARQLTAFLLHEAP